jgi:cobalt/nickel transport system permease protein
VAAAAVAAAAARARKTLDERMVPVVGVMGAFIFAAQMVNFPIWTGTSGHLAGGFLLGALCGWSPALLTMTAVLTIQCLVFGDGGLDALGANILNIGLAGCLLGGLVHRVWRQRGPKLALPLAGLGAWLAVVIGAALVVVEFHLSGRLNSSALLWGMTATMVGLHTLIGLVEGAVTMLVLAYVARTEVAAGLGSVRVP